MGRSLPEPSGITTAHTRKYCAVYLSVCGRTISVQYPYNSIRQYQLHIPLTFGNWNRLYFECPLDVSRSFSLSLALTAIQTGTV